MPEHEFVRSAKETPELPSSVESLGLDAPTLGNTSQAVQRARASRPALRPADVLALQRTAGNQAVQRLLRGEQATRPDSVQRHHDEEEEEETVSRQVVDSSRSGSARSCGITPTFQQEARVARKAADLRGASKIAKPEPGKNLGSVRVGAGHLVQRAGNWEKFKSYTKDIWGSGGSYRRENQWALEALDPREHYREHAQKGGKWNKFKGVMSGTGHMLHALPFALLGGALSTTGRGLQTLGAGAYYGAKGLGSSLYSGGKSMWGGMKRFGGRVKDWFNKDRNPNRYDRDRLPTTMNNTVELGKPLVALGTSGGVMGGVESVGTGMGTPAGVGSLNLLTLLDSLMTWKSGNKREEESRKLGDKGGEILGKRKANQGKWGTLGALMGTVQGGLNLGNVIDVGSKGMMSFNDLIGEGSKFVSTGLGVAGAGLGIAGGAITSMQGLWKSGKAVGKLRSLSKSVPMLSPDGDRWKARIKNREKTKLGLNALKTLGGLLGITAGALIIASNPVGWALGIAGAATVGGLFAYKLINKFRKSRKRQQAKKRVRRKMELEEQERLEQERLNQERLEQEQQEEQEEPQQLLEEVQKEHENDVGEGGGEGGENVGGGGENVGGENVGGGGGEVPVQDVDPGKLDKEKRKRSLELGNRVAQEISQSAKVAGEMRAALPWRKTELYGYMMEDLKSGRIPYSVVRQYGDVGKGYPLPERKAHDAVALLGVLNLTAEQAESESGQELIEKKISATDSL